MDHIPEQLMYDLVDGELSTEESERVIAHVSGCEKCKEVLAEILAVEEGGRNLWHEKLSKAFPDVDTLFDYFDGRLHGHGLKAVKKHIEDCPLCRGTVSIAKSSQERFMMVAILRISPRAVEKPLLLPP